MEGQCTSTSIESESGRELFKTTGEDHANQHVSFNLMPADRLQWDLVRLNCLQGCVSWVQWP